MPTVLRIRCEECKELLVVSEHPVPTAIGFAPFSSSPGVDRPESAVYHAKCDHWTPAFDEMTLEEG